jgi:(2Fe-2S) ferredoxin
MAPYARHVFICTGEFCDPEGRAKGLYGQLGHMLGDIGRYDNPRRVKRGQTPCLGVCTAGPILVVYPDGIWYHHVDEALLARIVEEYLKEGTPVKAHIFHQLNLDNEVARDGSGGGNGHE